jgi:formylglycine-generating enzyme required for sulfatase activity
MYKFLLCCFLVLITGCGEDIKERVEPPKEQITLNPKGTANLAKAQFMHGWSASQVQALQRETAKKLGIKEGVSFQDVITVNGKSFNAPKMVIIPPATYLQGCYDFTPSCFPRNFIKVITTIRYPFAVAERELSVADWNVCVDVGYCEEKPHDGNSTFNDTSNRPVTYVSWSDAQGYVKWLSKATGKNYRLLFEQEHEYASRAGGYGILLGNLLDCEDTKYQNYKSDECYFNSEERRNGELVEKNYPANAFGLFSMHSHMWEWIEDCYQSTEKNTHTSGIFYPNKSPCKSRLYIGRGGSMGGIKRIIRASNRHVGRPDKPFYDFGIRIAREIE